MKKTFIIGADYIMDILKGKWKASIISSLGYQPMYYHELFLCLNSKASKCSKKVLSSSLKQLIQDQLVKRQVYSTVPPQVKYSLTDEGQKICKLIINLDKLGEQLAGKKGDIDFMYRLSEIQGFFSQSSSNTKPFDPKL